MRRVYEPVTKQDGIRVLFAAGEQATVLRHLTELAQGRTITLLTASRDPAISEAD
ncbi:hypothetical protein K1T35_37020 [Pseudonocardia sp. DSM 110487]|uniref:hypothetical protein n=1 Tax=Pseudonocardia sp. DSM 110487 TaxID=2865833 RepID=UPI001C6A1C05|nr:hypothetical protein [Pseudonocardia sp. DSM 110487]QYN34001.1 hypothetical protein K1T35_37020 [Pseudonocardia sp. DSM 110487]